MKKICQHCGVHFRTKKIARDYCCNGCEEVALLIQGEGLDGFYALRDQPGRPIGKLPEDDFIWARELQRTTELEGLGQARIRVEGMTCAGCTWLIEHLFQREVGAGNINISTAGRFMDLSWEAERFSLEAFLAILGRHGYRTRIFRAGWVQNWSPFTWRLLISALFAINASAMSWLSHSSNLNDGPTIELFHLLHLAFYGMTLFVAGSYFFVPAINALIKAKISKDWWILIPITVLFWSGKGLYLPWLLSSLLLIHWSLQKITGKQQAIR
jgi:Cu2+-exporting ATPase